MTSISKLINIRRNCDKGEAHACDCVLQVCVFVNCLRIGTFQDLRFQLFFCLDSSMATLWAVYESEYLRTGMSTNRAICESTCNPTAAA